MWNTERVQHVLKFCIRLHFIYITCDTVGFVIHVVFNQHCNWEKYY